MNLSKALPFFFAAVLAGISPFLFSQASQSAKAKRPSVALVLSGGGARGFAHIPVLELIEELDIPVDIVIGTSAGAIVGGLYCAGYTPQDLKDVFFNHNWVKFFQDRPQYPLDDELGAHSLHAKPINLKFVNSGLVPDFGQGFSTGQHAYILFKSLTAKIPSYIDFDSLPIPFRSVAVNFQTGDIEVFNKGDLAEAIRASMSIPAVFEPFPMDGKYYLDGGVRSNTPIQQAKELGYDIIIVVEMYGDAMSPNQMLEGTTTMSIPQVYNIYLNSMNVPQQDLADVILAPNLRGFTMFDFPKAREIYNRSAEEKAKFRQQLIEVRKKIFPGQNVSGAASESSTLRVRVDGAEHTFSLVDKAEQKNARESYYSKLPGIVVRELLLRGAVPSDEQYIEKQFLKLIAGNTLTSALLEEFITLVYKTGNYNFVIARADVRYGEPALEVILYQTEHDKTLLLLGGSFQSTITSDAVSKLSLSTDIQFRGMTGAGSVLAFSADFVSDTAAELLFLQPFSPSVYAALTAFVRADQDFVASGFAVTGFSGSRVVSGGASMKFGIRFDEHHSVQAGAGISWFDTDESFTNELELADKAHPDSRSHIAVPVTFNYTFSTLDFNALPMSGYYVRAVNTAVFPLANKNVPIAYNIVDADFSAVISLGHRFSVAASAAAGSDITRNLAAIPYQIPMFGYNSFDRMYFPHSAGKKLYGTHKGAAQIAFLFQPWDNVTILGGQIIFSTSVSAGQIAMNYENFSRDKLLWNASFNVGVRINRAFAIQFRAGAGCINEDIAPFISLDIGAIRF